jgi:hypothetical protein
MKKAFIIALFLSPLACVAQRDFNYSITFTKRTTYWMENGKRDTTSVPVDITIEKHGTKLSISNSPSPATIYTVIYRGYQQGTFFYISGFKDIAIAPIEGIMRIVDGGKTELYQ